MDNRQVFPLIYDAHHASHLEDIPFWLEILQGSEGPILELGCGTGRVAVPLAKSGYQIFGLDNDHWMLRFLCTKIREIPDLQVFPIQADMTAFHLGLQFNTILLPCNTLSIFPQSKRRTIFKCISTHLKDQGVFSASLPNPLLLASLPAVAEIEIDEIFEHPLDQEPIQVSSEWNRDGEIFKLTWYYDHLLPDGLVKRLTIHSIQYLNPLEGYIEEMASQGLKLCKVYGDFDHSPYRPDSPYLILLAEKA